jgi:hypothetical protein
LPIRSNCRCERQRVTPGRAAACKIHPCFPSAPWYTWKTGAVINNRNERACLARRNSANFEQRKAQLEARIRRVGQAQALQKEAIDQPLDQHRLSELELTRSTRYWRVCRHRHRGRRQANPGRRAWRRGLKPTAGGTVNVVIARIRI